MKYIFSIFLLVVISFSVNAQTEKGRWNAGLSVGSFTFQSNQFGYQFAGSLSPSAGYFAMDNLLVGLGLPVGLSSSKYSSSSSAGNISQTNKASNLGLSPFLRYYFGKAKIKPVMGFSYTYSVSNVTSKNSLSTPEESTYKWRGSQITPSLGLAYFINRTVSLDAHLGYNWVRGTSLTPPRSTGTNKNVSLEIGFNLFFGQ